MVPFFRFDFGDAPYTFLPLVVANFISLASGKPEISLILLLLLSRTKLQLCVGPLWIAAFSPCWHAPLDLGIVALLLPGSMHSDGGYSGVEVQTIVDDSLPV